MQLLITQLQNCVNYTNRACATNLIVQWTDVGIYIAVDALFAVYEASTLELWSFMMYSAIEKHGPLIPSLFYMLLIVFVVILLQVMMCLTFIFNYKCIFLLAKHFSCCNNRIICWFKKSVKLFLETKIFVTQKPNQT